MSDYREYLAKRPALRPAEDDTGARRRVVFGNPFKSVRSSDPHQPPPTPPGHVDEADDMQDTPAVPVAVPPQQQPQQPQQTQQQPPGGMKRPPQKEESAAAPPQPQPPPAKRAAPAEAKQQTQQAQQQQAHKVPAQTHHAAVRRALWGAIRTPDCPATPLDRAAFCARLQTLGGPLAARRALVGELIAQARAFNALRPLRLLEEYLQTLAS